VILIDHISTQFSFVTNAGLIDADHRWDEKFNLLRARLQVARLSSRLRIISISQNKLTIRDSREPTTYQFNRHLPLCSTKARASPESKMPKIHYARRSVTEVDRPYIQSITQLLQNECSPNPLCDLSNSTTYPPLRPDIISTILPFSIPQHSPVFQKATRQHHPYAPNDPPNPRQKVTKSNDRPFRSNSPSPPPQRSDHQLPEHGPD
jgi:hypothetical protein